MKNMCQQFWGKALLNKGLRCIVTLLLGFGPFGHVFSNDLLQGNDLQDSILSSSINKQLAVDINGENRIISINQYGIHNQAIVNQKGTGLNSIKLVQRGINNSASLLQDGVNNQINLEQQGLGNQAEIVQEGSDNIVNLLQAGERQFVVHQIGDGLVVSVTQY